MESRNLTAPSAPIERHRHSIVLLMSLAFVGALYWNSETELPGAFSSTAAEKVVAGVPFLDSNSHSRKSMVLVNEPSRRAKTVIEEASENDRLLQLNLAQLEAGYDRLQNTSGYTATFCKQERIDGELHDEQVMDLKLRHVPFSVYMKWQQGEVGREMLYVDGEHDGKMVVHPGGLRGRILPALKIDPESELSTAESRHPVTRLGLLNLTGQIIARRHSDMKSGCRIRCEKLDDATVDDRPCDVYVLTWATPEESETYRKSIHCIDKESSLLVCVKNFGWPETAESATDRELDDATLIEHYQYTNLQLDNPPSAADFDCENDEYAFRR